jgi:uncharacterized membrane protein YccC
MKTYLFAAVRDAANAPDLGRSSTVLYAVEIMSTTVILSWTFRVAGATSVSWAIITAILILQPGLGQSVKASQVRIVATLIGAFIGALAGLFAGGDMAALLVGILATIVFCHHLGWKRHLRQACLTIPIVQMQHQGGIVHVSYERITAILAGCVVPLLVQYAGQFACRELSTRLRKSSSSLRNSSMV